MVVVERGRGEADAGGRGRAACDALALCDGGRGGGLRGGVPFLLEDLEEALDVPRAGVGAGRDGWVCGGGRT